MKQKSYLIGFYSFLIFVGGMIGYIAAQSLISLIVSSLFALALSACSFFVGKGYRIAYDIAIGIIFTLLTFFVYRFALTSKLMPGGIMACISGALFFYLLIKRKQILSIKRVEIQ